MSYCRPVAQSTGALQQKLTRAESKYQADIERLQKLQHDSQEAYQLAAAEHTKRTQQRNLFRWCFSAWKALALQSLLSKVKSLRLSLLSQPSELGNVAEYQQRVDLLRVALQ